jgi:putative ABC transport system permease protein
MQQKKYTPGRKKLMNILENIAASLAGLKSNKMRAFLTMLGIIIGISAVILITTLGTMIKNTFTGTVDDLGFSNYVQIHLAAKDIPDRVQRRVFESDYITDEMITLMKERFGERIESATIISETGRAYAQYDKKEDELSVYLNGYTGEGLRAESTDIIAGRYISDDDLAKMRNVINIPSDMAEKMYGDADSAIGKVIAISDRNHYWRISTTVLDFTIVGVYKQKFDPSAMMGGSYNRTYNCNIPITTARHLTGNRAFDGAYFYFSVIGAPGEDVTALGDDITAFFNNGYYRNNNSYETASYTMVEDLELIDSALTLISVILGLIAAVSLFVGGIGVMNIMLVSVTERTREIGVRKALGAPNSAIRFQFIVESVILCTIGGILGIILGIAFAILTGNLFMYVLADRLSGITLNSSPSVTAIVISVIFSMAIGVFFGYYPANKAAKLNPIDALRYE